VPESGNVNADTYIIAGTICKFKSATESRILGARMPMHPSPGAGRGWGRHNRHPTCNAPSLQGRGRGRGWGGTTNAVPTGKTDPAGALVIPAQAGIHKLRRLRQGREVRSRGIPA